jgi:hypothetical protein
MNGGSGSAPRRVAAAIPTRANSIASSAASVGVGGIGQPSPAELARSKQSLTALRAKLVRANHPVSRTAPILQHFSRKIPRTQRLGTRSAGIGSPPKFPGAAGYAVTG